MAEYQLKDYFEFILVQYPSSKIYTEDVSEFKNKMKIIKLVGTYKPVLTFKTTTSTDINFNIGQVTDVTGDTLYTNYAYNMYKNNFAESATGEFEQVYCMKMAASKYVYKHIIRNSTDKCLISVEDFGNSSSHDLLDLMNKFFLKGTYKVLKYEDALSLIGYTDVTLTVTISDYQLFVAMIIYFLTVINYDLTDKKNLLNQIEMNMILPNVLNLFENHYNFKSYDILKYILTDISLLAEHVTNIITFIQLDGTIKSYLILCSYTGDEKYYFVDNNIISNMSSSSEIILKGFIPVDQLDYKYQI